jgi:hypothetical protein
MQTLCLDHSSRRPTVEGGWFHERKLDQVEAGPAGSLNRALDASRVELPSEHQRVATDE